MRLFIFFFCLFSLANIRLWRLKLLHVIYNCTTKIEQRHLGKATPLGQSNNTVHYSLLSKFIADIEPTA